MSDLQTDTKTPPTQSEKKWDVDQQIAIERCCSTTERVVAVTGGAGTGKTSLIEEVYRQLTSAGYNVAVSTPTGKAAKRVQEATGVNAQTNHRLLGYGMPIEDVITDIDGKKKRTKLSTGPKYGKYKPFEYDYLLCDEYAMVNRTIHSELIFSMKSGARIRMFGDMNQLKPIEEGKWQKDKTPEATPFEAALNKFNGITLNTNHRQNQGSGIHINAQAILAGNYPRRLDDCGITITDHPVKVVSELVQSSLERGIDFSTPDHQIITQMNKSWIGTQKLNPVLQGLFWKNEHKALQLPKSKWNEDRDPIKVQVGSKVVNTSNAYDLGNGHSMFNGEVGVVVDIDHEFGSLDIDFGDRIVNVPPLVVMQHGDRQIEFDPRTNLDLAYVLTTHKMQGSECKSVVIMLNKSTAWMQSRRNLYTALTRARESATIISDQVSITRSIKVKD
jgi:exodeoxyribonuclease V alpha subunit